MSYPEGPQTTPAGWYPDPAGSPQQRWWDGTQWTDHLQTPAAPSQPATPAYQTPASSSAGQAPYGTAGQAPYGAQGQAQTPGYPAAPGYQAPGYGTAAHPPVAPGTPAYGPFIWVITLLPLLSLLLLPLSLADVENSLRSAAYGSYDYDPYGGMSPTGLILQAVATLLGWALYGAGVVLAYFDRKWLLRQGYAQPFHWAFAFLGVVYPIGRSVVVRRRSGRGIAPMWVTIGILALSLVITIGITVWLINLMVSTLGPLGSYT